MQFLFMWIRKNSMYCCFNLIWKKKYIICLKPLFRRLLIQTLVVGGFQDIFFELESLHFIDQFPHLEHTVFQTLNLWVLIGRKNWAAKVIASVHYIFAIFVIFDFGFELREQRPGQLELLFYFFLAVVYPVFLVIFIFWSFWDQPGLFLLIVCVWTGKLFA